MNRNLEILKKFVDSQSQRLQDDISKQGYKDNSPYRNNPSNTIYGTPQGTPITMKGVSTPLIGMDEFGNKQNMQPGQEYFFPGTQVTETRTAKYGGLLNKTVTCSNCGWSWKAADGGNDVSTCHKCGAEVNSLLKAQYGNAGNDVVNWTKDYVNSPKYKERITNSGYNDPDKQILKRLQNLENVNFTDKFKSQGTVYNPNNNTVETNYPADMEYYNIHKNLYPTKPDLNSIIAHELGHSETNRRNSGSSLLNKYDTQQLKNRLLPSAYDDQEVFINNILKHDASHNNIIPEENKADLNSFRYDLRNQYDAGTQDFTEDYLKNSPDSFAKERLLKNYSKEDLIWLMNNVAQNDSYNNQMPIAQLGGAGMMYADRDYQVGGATRSDSLAVYNNSRKVEQFYNKNNYEPAEGRGRTYKTATDENNLAYARFKDNHSSLNVNLINPSISQKLFGISKEDYKKEIDKNKYLQREYTYGTLNMDAPMQLYDKRIEPATSKAVTNSKLGDFVEIKTYNNIANKPFDLLTDSEKKQRVKEFGTNGVPKSYLDKIKKLQQEVIVKPATTKPITKPINIPVKNTPVVEREKYVPLPPLISKGLEDIDVQIGNSDISIPIHTRFPQSYDVTSQRQTMNGLSDYYNYDEQGVSLEQAVKAKQAADAYNQYVLEKYGNSKNPKAQERLKQLTQDVQVTPNYQNGGLAKAQYGDSVSRFKAAVARSKAAGYGNTPNQAMLSTDKRTQMERESDARLSDKELERKARMRKEILAQGRGQFNSTQDFKDANGAIDTHMRVSLNDNVFDDYINPAVWMGTMANKLGAVPDNINRGNYGQAAMAFAEPLAFGAGEAILAPYINKGLNVGKQFINSKRVLPIVGNYKVPTIAESWGKYKPLVSESEQGLEPYISRIGEPRISREEEVFRNAMGKDYKKTKELENTIFLDAQGNKTFQPIKDEPLKDIDYIKNFKENRNGKSIQPNEGDPFIPRRSSIIDINGNELQSPSIFDYMSLEAPKGNMYGENQVLTQQSRFLDPAIKAKFFEHQAPYIEPKIERNLLFERIMKLPKDYNNRITPENYEEFVKNIHGSTGYDLATNSWKKPENLGIGNYGKTGTVYSDAPLNDLGKDIINAHEKNHGMFAGTMSAEMKESLLKPFGTKRPIPHYADKHQADEVLARMAQFKNAVGIGNNQTFTLGHLNLIRKNYATQFLDNSITPMLEKIKPGSIAEKEFLKNMNKYAFGSIPVGLGLGAAASMEQKKTGGTIQTKQNKALSWINS